MGSSGSFNPISVIADLVFSAISGAQGPAKGQDGASQAASQAQAEAEAAAEEREAKARRDEDRRAEEAALKAQARRQQLVQSRQEGGSSLGAAGVSSLGDGGSLAGQSVHAGLSTQPQLKEKLGQ